MGRLLRAELLKVTTTRTFIALVGAAVGLSLLVVVLTSTLADTIAPEDARAILTTDASGLFILLLGVIGMTGEWRHRTIAGTFLAAPARLRLVLAKGIAYAVAGAVLSVCVTVVAAVVMALLLTGPDKEMLPFSDVADVLWRNALLAAIGGALGVGIGGLVRNQPAAIVIVLIGLFVVGPTLNAVAPKVGRYEPFTGAPAAVSDTTFDEDDDFLEEALSPGAGVLVLLGWVALTLGGTAVLLRERDLT